VNLRLYPEVLSLLTLGLILDVDTTFHTECGPVPIQRIALRAIELQLYPTTTAVLGILGNGRAAIGADDPIPLFRIPGLNNVHRPAKRTFDFPALNRYIQRPTASRTDLDIVYWHGQYPSSQ
jgi:hypothetical protein